MLIYPCFLIVHQTSSERELNIYLVGRVHTIAVYHMWLDPTNFRAARGQLATAIGCTLSGSGFGVAHRELVRVHEEAR